MANGSKKPQDEFDVFNDLDKELHRTATTLSDTLQSVVHSVSETVRQNTAEGVQRLNETLRGTGAQQPKQPFSRQSFTQQPNAQPFSGRSFSQQANENLYSYQYGNKANDARVGLSGKWAGIGLGAMQSFKRFLCIAGGGIAAVYAAGVAVTALISLITGNLAGGIAALCFSGVLGWGSACGFGAAKRMRRFTAYLSILGDRDSCTVQELAVVVRRSPDYVRRDLEKMIHKGYFRAACLNAEGTVLYESGAVYMAQLQDARVAPSQVPQEDAPTLSKRELLSEECNTFLRDLHTERARIEEAPVLEQIDKIEQQTKLIFTWMQTHPNSSAAVRRFSNYYLPTVLKLLHTYNEVDPQAGDSAVAGQIQTDIVGILYTINKAFSGLQDSLLADTALDVSAEISALETVLAQEGLTGNAFETAP